MFKYVNQSAFAIFLKNMMCYIKKTTRKKTTRKKLPATAKKLPATRKKTTRNPQKNYPQPAFSTKPNSVGLSPPHTRATC
jgi:hypothetical protein